MDGIGKHGRWDERYAREDYLFGEEPNAFLRNCRDVVRQHKRALAIADGEGRNGVWLAAQGLDVLSFDASPVAIGKASRLAAKRGVALRTRVTDIAGFDWSAERFDLVVAIFIQFAAPPLRDSIFAGIREVLEPGGRLILEGYRPEQIAYGTGGPSQPEHLYDRDMLARAFSDFEIEHLQERDVVIEEGSGHSGMSAVIDLIARKPAKA
jgi:SAM-dependent methyltransferase